MSDRRYSTARWQRLRKAVLQPDSGLNVHSRLKIGVMPAASVRKRSRRAPGLGDAVKITADLLRFETASAVYELG